MNKSRTFGTRVCVLSLIGAAVVVGGWYVRGLKDEGKAPPPTRSSSTMDEPEGPLIVKAPSQPPEGMAWVPGGTFRMGTEDGKSDEYPAHEVQLDGFWMDVHEVTNAEFSDFVEATGYKTAAEKQPDFSSVRPGSERTKEKILPELNKPGSICMIRNLKSGDVDPARGPYSWWEYVPGANWKHPEGPGSSIAEKLDHPVVHVSWHDTQAYCRWAGKRLPSEAQWEYGARGGREGQAYPWGNERNPGDKWLHNIWQGEFPVSNTTADGFDTTAPVGAFSANAYGLFDMSGNVWEWCHDNYAADYYLQSPKRNPPGPAISLDPDEPDILKRIQRGGSFMCSETYCTGYRVSARMKGEEGSGLYHTGFRCVVLADGIDKYRAAPARKSDGP